MKNKNIYFLIFILFLIILATSYFIYYSNFKKIKITEISGSDQEYSFKNLIYNFWGITVAKEDNAVLVEGIIPKVPEIGKGTNQSIQTIKFKINPETKIVKLEKTKQVFANLETIKLGDHLGLKADEIDFIKKEAVATDILISELLPFSSLSPEEKNNSVIQ